MLPRGEVVTRCRSGIKHRSRHSQFWGWRKVVPVWVAYWMYPIHIQLGILGLRKITKESMNLAASLMVPCCCCCCCYWRADGRRLYRTKLFSQRECLTVFPNYCSPERWFGLNRISHTDWVKLCVELRAKQKYENSFCYKATKMEELKVHIWHVIVQEFKNDTETAKKITCVYGQSVIDCQVQN